MQYRLTVDDKVVGVGVLSVGKDGDAHFFEGNGDSGARILAEMVRTKLDWAGALAIRLTGFTLTGKIDKRGVPLYRFAEWTLCYLEQKK